MCTDRKEQRVTQLTSDNESVGHGSWVKWVMDHTRDPLTHNNLKIVKAIYIVLETLK